MKEKNYTFTENQVEFLCDSIIAKMGNNNRAIEMVTNNAARIERLATYCHCRMR